MGTARQCPECMCAGTTLKLWASIPLVETIIATCYDSDLLDSAVRHSVD